MVSGNGWYFSHYQYMRSLTCINPSKVSFNSSIIGKFESLRRFLSKIGRFIQSIKYELGIFGHLYQKSAFMNTSPSENSEIKV